MTPEGERLLIVPSGLLSTAIRQSELNRADRAYRDEVLARRTQVLEALADELATTQSVGPEALAREEFRRRIRVMPGVGAILAPFVPATELLWRIWNEDTPDILSTRYRLAGPPSEPDGTLNPRWHLDKVGVDPTEARGEKVLVGVVDSGIAPIATEFGNRISAFVDCRDGVSCLPTQANDNNAASHGTKMCGLIASNSLGVAPSASLVVAAVSSPEGTWEGRALVLALEWLAVHRSGGSEAQVGVDVLSLSLERSDPGFDSALHTVIQNIVAAGICVVAAVGNTRQHNEHRSPGNFSEVISVGCTDIDDLPRYSAWGEGPDIAVPPYQVPTVVAPGQNAWTINKDGTYTQSGQSSAATAITAGVVAARIGSDSTLRNNPEAVKDCLMASARPLPDVERAGAGVVALANPCTASSR